MITLSPSLLSANFANLNADINTLEEAGIDELHLDIMDGHFVDNITFGPALVASLRPLTDMHFDAHLMVTNPEKLFSSLANAGTGNITVHAETVPHLYHTLEKIKKMGLSAGVALNPATDFRNLIYPALDDLIDRILVMSVEPGFGGQKFLPMSLYKIDAIKHWRANNNLNFTIQVDGGINADNINTVIQAGADNIVMGSAVFRQRKIAANICNIKNIIKQEN